MLLQIDRELKTTWKIVKIREGLSFKQNDFQQFQNLQNCRSLTQK